MKVGIVGNGFVGATAAYAMVMEGIGREIVLVDKNETRSRAEANDIHHAVPFAHPLKVTSGSYADLKGSSAVIIAAGVKPEAGREPVAASATQRRGVPRCCAGSSHQRT